MAHKLYPKVQTFFGTTGQLLAGGELRFFEVGTSTPKNVYGEYALTTNNGSTVALDASGRPSVAIWGSGDYSVEIYNSSGVSQGQDECREPASLSIPIPAAGEFVTGNGTTFSVATIREVPDPTGHPNKVLGTDGTTPYWTSAQAGSTASHQVVTAAATTTIDLSLGTNILLNHGTDITTLAFTNPPSTTAAYIVSITRVKDATGTARAISNLSTLATFPAGVPTLTQTTGAVDVLALKFEPSVTKARGSYMLNLS